jgi:hypothetical protein
VNVALVFEKKQLRFTRPARFVTDEIRSYHNTRGFCLQRDRLKHITVLGTRSESLKTHRARKQKLRPVSANAFKEHEKLEKKLARCPAAVAAEGTLKERERAQREKQWTQLEALSHHLPGEGGPRVQQQQLRNQDSYKRYAEMKSALSLARCGIWVFPHRACPIFLFLGATERACLLPPKFAHNIYFRLQNFGMCAWRLHN